jgi:hypothetical protein
MIMDIVAKSSNDARNDIKTPLQRSFMDLKFELV